MEKKSHLAKRIFELEILSSKVSREIFSGNYRSTFKGKGMSFDKVREYQIGDDIKNIDWNVTARLNVPHIKIFEEERDLDFILLLDFSSSMNYGGERTKKDLMIEIAAILVFSAMRHNDKIGALIYTNAGERYIPPNKGRKHGLHILSELINFQSKRNTNNFSRALRKLDAYLKKPVYVFAISDFLDDEINEMDLKRFKTKHDITCIAIKDRVEMTLPTFGFLHLYHAETGEKFWFNTFSKRQRVLFERDYQNNRLASLNVLKRCGVDVVQLDTDKDYIAPLKKYFSKKR